MEKIKRVFSKAHMEIRRIISFLLSVVLIVTSCQTTALAASDVYSTYLDGWYVQSAWSTLSTDYEWNATRDESRQPKIVVTYRTNNAERDYPAGSIHFTIPGIGNAYRGEIKKASELAADKADSEWNYTWDENTDTYTFTNKFEVKTGQSVSGGFELMWSYNARDCENEFSQSASPTFTVDGAGDAGSETITLEPLTYSFTSVRDNYRIYLNQTKITAEEYDNYDKNYTWYEFDTTFNSDYYARGLYKSNYFVSVTVPDDVEVSDGDIIAYYGGSKVSLEQVDDYTYGFYPYKERRGDIVTRYDYSPHCYVKFGFKSSVFYDSDSKTGKEVTFKGHLDRLYNDESEWTTTAGANEIVDVTKTFTVETYAFTHSGYIYTHDKHTNGGYEYSWYNHSEPYSYANRLPATSIFNGKIVEFSLYGKAKRSYAESNATANASLRTSLRARSMKKASSSDIENDEVLQSITDWDDLSWEENGLVDLSAEELGELDGASYSAMHPEDTSTVSLTELEETKKETTAEATEAAAGTGAGTGTANAAGSSVKKEETVETNASTETNAVDTTTEASKEETVETEKETEAVSTDTTDASNETEEKAASQEKENTIDKAASQEEDTADTKDTVSEKTDTTEKSDAEDTSSEKADTEKTSVLSNLLRKTASLFSITAIAAEKASASDIVSAASLTNENSIALASEIGDKHSDTHKGDTGTAESLAGNTTGVSQIKADQEYALLMGDDKLAIMTNSGNIRELTDDEYDIAYVTVPKYGNYEYEIYGAETQDTAFGDYTLIATGNTGDYATTQLPSGVKAVFVRVNGITGTYEYYINVGVRLHLSWEKDQELEENEQVDRDGKVINFSYLRAMYVDADSGLEMNDCARTSENYVGSYGDTLSARDKETYNEYLLRDYSHVWLRNPVTVLSSSVSMPDYFSGNPKTGFSANVFTSGSIKSDNSGELKSFSLYAEIPEGLTIDLDSEDFTISGTGTNLAGDTVTNFMDHASISERDVDGKHYLVADFDFSDDPLDSAKSTSASLSFKVDLTYVDFLTYGTRYTITSYLMPHDAGLDRISGDRIKTDQYDIDENGSITDKMSYYSDDSKVSDSATEWREYVSKFVKTAYSTTYETDAVTRLYSDTDSADMKAKSDYQYRLDFGLGSSNAKNIVFYDHIEQGATLSVSGDTTDTSKTVESEWQGTFVSVDTSKAEKMGLVPTIYYSTNPAQPDSLEASGWTTEKPEDTSSVKSIAVELNTDKMDDGLMKTREMTYILVNMRAPSDRKYIDKKAVNQYHITYDAYGLTKEYDKKYTLPSAETYVKLLDNIGKIILQKVDADNVLSTTEDGTKKYASLTGAKIQVYDPDGKAMFEDGGKEVSSLGRITLNNVKHGKYQWEETEAPKGYQKIDGKHDFNIDGVTSVINIENHRIPGSVTLTKQDGDDKSYGPLAGATFTIYKADGTEILTDSNYAYSESGTNRTFTTSTDGTLTVTDLPWGSYYFLETTAPDGYEVNSTKWTFSIGKAQYQEESNTVHADVTATDPEKTASIELSKLDSEDGRAIKDAVFELYKVGTADPVKKNLKTNAAGEILVEDLKFGEYYFKETRNAGGYLLPEEGKRETGHVTLDATTVGETLKVSMTNDRMKGSVVLTKEDDEKQLVGGATYALYHKGTSDKDYSLYDSYTTNSDKSSEEYGEIHASDLPWGDYYFIETKAPKGYKISDEKVKFTIDQKSVQNVIYVETVDTRATGTVKLTKVDKNQKTKTLSGAVYELYKSDGTKCVFNTDYKVAGDGTSITTGTDGTVTITDLKQGAYYLKELTAPASYTLSDELIRFSITKENADVVQDLTAEDEAGKAVIKINKVINEAYKPFGDPTFIFKVVRDDGKTYEKSITLSDAETEGSVTLTVEQGHSYTISEVNAQRYRLTNVEGVTNVTVNGTVGTADLENNDSAEVTFTNEITQYESFSHVTNATNIVKSSTKYTALSVEYTGADPITTNLSGYDAEEEVYTIPKSDLVVTAFYDDGTSKVLSAGDYTLEPGTVDGSSNSFTGTVIYTEGAVTKKATYQLNVKLPQPTPRYDVTFDLQGGTIIWDGTNATTENPKIRVKSGQTVKDKMPSTVKDPTKDKYKFLGWVTEAGVTDEETAKAKVFTLDTTVISKDTTIYAAWQKVFDVKYAVSIYGIKQDEYEGGGSDTAGLTFGPATGENYVSSFKSHTPNGNTDSGNTYRCVHDDDWATIIEWSKKDPYVYSQCIAEGCTHSVELTLSDKLKGVSYSNMTGDGAGYLYDAIDSAYRMWNETNSNSGGWPASRIRSTLNGKDATSDGYLNTTVAGTDCLDKADALISAFPEELQNAIVAKKVKSDTVYSDYSDNNKPTYDKLWLFSGKELYQAGNSNTDVIRANEGTLYERQEKLGITTNNYSKMKGYYSNGSSTGGWWLRSPSRDYSSSVCVVYSDGGWNYNYAYYYGRALAPGFSVK